MPYRHAPVEPPSDLRCPRCQSDLCTQAVGPNQVERCPRCHGVWMAAAEFNELLGDLDRREAVRVHELPHRESHGESPEPVGYLACPRCGQIMARRNFGRTSGILVDTCKKHGIWLDRGELRRVVDHLAQRAPDDLARPKVAPARAREPVREPEPEPVRENTFLDALLELLGMPFH